MGWSEWMVNAELAAGWEQDEQGGQLAPIGDPV